MELREYLVDVAGGYDRAGTMSSSSQSLLRHAARHVGHVAPAGFITTGSGGIGNPTPTPWFGFLDPDETDTPQDGIYVVFIFESSLAHVRLILIQGINRLYQEVGARLGQEKLASDGEAIRQQLPAPVIAGLDTATEFGYNGPLQRGYRAGTIVAKRFALRALPSEPQLQHELDRFFDVYQLAIEAKRYLLQANPGAISSSSAPIPPVPPADDPLAYFKPKDATDYIAHIVGKTQVKTRRHEALIRDYGKWAAVHGFTASTAEHPKDLVLRQGSQEWIVEGKVVRRGNANGASREATGQLLAYRHFLTPPHGTHPALLALFTEEIGTAFVDFLGTLGIDSVWWQDGQWLGSDGARAAGLTDA